jgi:hypothetical protein
VSNPKASSVPGTSLSMVFRRRDRRLNGLEINGLCGSPRATMPERR